MKKTIIIFLLITNTLLAFSSKDPHELIDSLQALLEEEMDVLERADIHYEIAQEMFLLKPENAYAHISEFIRIARAQDNDLYLYDGYIALSDFLSLMNDYQSSLEHLYKAYNIAEKQNDKSMVSYCHSRLSELFYFTDDLDKSIEHARLALAINYKEKDTIQLTYDFHNIAMWHLELDNYDSALYYLRKAITYYHHLGREPNPVFISHLGQTFSYMNEFDSALYYHFKALELDQKNSSEYEISIDENYIGNTYLRKKEYNKAIEYANASLQRATDMDLVDVMVFNYDLLLEAYEGKRDFEKALRFAQLRNDFSDTLRDKNKESIIQGLNARFNFNQQQQKLQVQEAENTLLRKQKTLLLFITILSLLLIISLLVIAIQVYHKHKANRKLLDELERANNSKERLISVISHDLRSSIGTMRNSIQLINDDSLDNETVKELLESFFPVVDSTYDLLENLLTWASYNKGNLEPSAEILDIKPIIEKSIQHTLHLAESKSIEIVNRVEDAIVTADKNMLSTVIRNLLSNAVKFSHPKSRVIITSVSNSEMAEIIVKDNGIGMKPEVLDKIFTRPTDFHSKGTRGERGSGLGLSICKSFIEKQGGHITATSKPGVGSTFTIAIPVVYN
jgi:signal transduction histidine kinase